MEGEDELDLGEEIEETEELSSPTAAKPDVPKIEETPNNEGGEEKNIERSELGSIKKLEDMLNKLLEAVQFTDRRCQAIEKKIEGVPNKLKAAKHLYAQILEYKERHSNNNPM